MKYLIRHRSLFIQDVYSNYEKANFIYLEELYERSKKKEKDVDSNEFLVLLILLYDLNGLTGRMDKAELLLKKISGLLNISKSNIDSFEMEIESLFNYARSIHHFQVGQIFEGVLLLSREIKLWIDEDQDFYGWLLKRRSILFSSAFRLNKAIEDLEVVLTINRNKENYEEVSHALSRLASIHNEYGNSHKAIELEEQSLDLRKNLLNNPMHTAMSLQNLGNYYHKIGSLDKAKELITIAMKLFTENKNDYGVATCYLILGEVNLDMGSHDEAVAYLEAAETSWEKFQGRFQIAKAIGLLGWVAVNREDYVKANMHFSKSLRIFNEVKVTWGEQWIEAAISDLETISMLHGIDELMIRKAMVISNSVDLPIDEEGEDKKSSYWFDPVRQLLPITKMYQAGNVQQTLKLLENSFTDVILVLDHMDQLSWHLSGLFVESYEVLFGMKDGNIEINHYNYGDMETEEFMMMAIVPNFWNWKTKVWVFLVPDKAKPHFSDLIARFSDRLLEIANEEIVISVIGYDGMDFSFYRLPI